MGSSSEKFVPFYKTGDVTSRNPVIIKITSVTTLNLTVSIKIIEENLHFKVLWSNFVIYPIMFYSVLSVLLKYFRRILHKLTTSEGFPTKSVLFGYIEIRQKEFVIMAAQR
jgi:hypothetical protein